MDGYTDGWKDRWMDIYILIILYTQSSTSLISIHHSKGLVGDLKYIKSSLYLSSQILGYHKATTSDCEGVDLSWGMEAALEKNNIPA